MSTTAASMLTTINWRRLGRISKREQANREKHAPGVSSYRWWARRPHSVMGAILDAAKLRYGSRFTVSDPFSGGGTVAFEAVRRGLPTYAQDLYPWPSDGLATALTSTDSAALKIAAGDLLETLAPRRAQFASGDDSELTHVLRVRVGQCSHCEGRIFLFPGHVVSLASRSSGETRAYYGCTACGTVMLRKCGLKTYRCDGCGKRHNLQRPTTECPHCRSTLEPMGALHGDRQWKAVLVQRVVTESGLKRARLRPVIPGDCVPEEGAREVLPVLSMPIQKGVETTRLLAMGFEVWGDLYTRRQAQILADALSHIASFGCSDPIKDRLAFAVIGCAEMPAFLSRWDRTVLKPFEAVANHRYSQSTLVVEINPLAPVGRGTLERRLAASVKSLEWLTSECGELPSVTRVLSTGRRRAPERAEVIVATGSSKRQALPPGTVQLALTDPPYFSDVQYGELARLFHVWLSAYRPILALDELEEAVPNPVRGKGALSYRQTIAACLRETKRSLAKDGRLVLTFHNTKLAAWKALAWAIQDSGFCIRAVAVVHSENPADHCKRNVNSMLHDLVLECVPGVSNSPVSAAISPRTTAEKTLIAMGLALAKAIAQRQAELLPSLYDAELTRFGIRRSLIV